MALNLFKKKNKGFDAFISYRRDGSDTFARMLKTELENKKYKVYLDVDNLHSSYFDDQLLDVIKNCNNFILILTTGSLEKCRDADDWVRKELLHAISYKRNIIPIFNTGYKFPHPTRIPDELKVIPRYQSIKYNSDFHDASIDKLISYLNLDPIPFPKAKEKPPKKDPDENEIIETTPDEIEEPTEEGETQPKIGTITIPNNTYSSKENSLIGLGEIGIVSHPHKIIPNNPIKIGSISITKLN